MGVASGVFALEGDPELSLNARYSVRPILQFLRDLNGTDFIFRDVGTADELRHYFRQWTLAKNSKYNIGTSAFMARPASSASQPGASGPSRWKN